MWLHPSLPPHVSQEELDKETVGTATTIEDAGSQTIDRIGEKLSKHSKHNSFIYAESTMSKYCLVPSSFTL